MHRRFFFFAFCAGWLIACSQVAIAEGWGSIKGRFVIDGAAPVRAPIVLPRGGMIEDESLLVELKSGGVANVLVYLRDREAPIHPGFAAAAAGNVDVVIRADRFEPHVVPLRVSQSLVIRNLDQHGHNVLAQPALASPFNVLVPVGQQFSHQFDRANSNPFPLVDNIHPWMKAWILLKDHPYMAVSAKDGTFEIRNLPAGERELQLWHELGGYLEVTAEWPKGRRKLMIEADKTLDLGKLKLAPMLFKL